MNLLVVSSAPVMPTADGWVAYAPLVMELDLWFERPTTVTIVAPTKYNKPLLTTPFKRQQIKVVSIPLPHFGSFTGLLGSIWTLPIIKLKILWAMAKADHIHLRCPGNIGLVASWMQILFPRKRKTAKYAGNWDPRSKQPWSYKLQKWLLSNSLLTKNMQVLVYGSWPKQSKNIKPFFTATYWEADKKPLISRNFDGPISLVYLGTLGANKRVDYAIDLAAELIQNGIDLRFDIFGDGAQRELLSHKIEELNLQDRILLHGNKPKSEVTTALQKAHFAILPSRSEGWPKAIAEAMFWGAIPLASPVSCVPWMLDNGKRGVLLDFETDAETITAMLTRPRRLQNMSVAAAEWSREFTLDKFEREIHQLLVQ